jgi:hypothetical protein
MAMAHREFDTTKELEKRISQHLQDNDNIHTLKKVGILNPRYIHCKS